MAEGISNEQLAAVYGEGENQQEQQQEEFTEFMYENNNWQPNQNNINQNANKPGDTIVDFIKKGKIEKVNQYLEDNKATLATEIKKSPLVNFAVDAILDSNNNSPKQQNQFDILKALLAFGFTPSFPYATWVNINIERRPLNRVATSPSKMAVPIIKLLLQYGANVNGYDDDVYTRPPIFDSIQPGDLINRLEVLVENGADINIKYGSSIPLFKAMNVENVDAIKYLLEKGALISSYVNLIGDNLFMMAIKLSKTEKKREVVNAFLKRAELKADFVNKQSNKNALMYVVDQGDMEMLDLLLNDPRFLQAANVKIQPHGTLIDYAFSQTLLGSNPSDKPEKAELMMTFVIYLRKKGLQISKLDYSPFLNAVSEKAIPLIDSCIKIGLDINAADPSTGFTPLTYAVHNGSPEIVRYLLEKGADPTIKDSNGILPLTAAFYSANIEIIQLLMGDTPVDELEGTELILTMIKSQMDSEKVKVILHYLVDELGYNPFGANVENIPALMLASSVGNEGAVEFLLEKGADVNETKGKHKLTAYDVAKNMKIRLLLAPYLETGITRFRGFLEDDFSMISVMLEGDRYAICPFCFTLLNHTSGCMYIFEHNCVQQAFKRKKEAKKEAKKKEDLQAVATEKQAIVDRLRGEAGTTPEALAEAESQANAAEKAANNVQLITPLVIHKKLYDTYRDDRGNITVCIHCNRAGYTFDVPRGPGEPRRVDHRHIELNRGNPYVNIKKAQASGTAFNTRTCLHHGGGGPPEKLLRCQILLNFMCYLNSQYVGKISTNVAKRLAIEAFWDAPLDSIDFTKENPNYTFLDPSKKQTTQDVLEKIASDRKFLVSCEAPKTPLPLPEGVEEGVKLVEVFPNVPRYGTNDVQLAPINAGKNGTIPQGSSEPLTCFYQESILLEDPHPDERTLWRFRHRQPQSDNEFSPNRIYDHGTKNPKELICEECIAKVINMCIETEEIHCFNSGHHACEGHFHPSEVLGKIPDETYRAYKELYNEASPGLERGGGGSRKANADNHYVHSPLFGKPVLIEQNYCVSGGYKRYKNTRKARKGIKTRKGRRYNKTRKH